MYCTVLTCIPCSKIYLDSLKNMSHVTCHVQCVTCNFFLLFSLFFLQIGGYGRWRVGYQQGLPCLVVSAIDLFRIWLPVSAFDLKCRVDRTEPQTATLWLKWPSGANSVKMYNVLRSFSSNKSMLLQHKRVNIQNTWCTEDKLYQINTTLCAVRLAELYSTVSTLSTGHITLPQSNRTLSQAV